MSCLYFFFTKLAYSPFFCSMSICLPGRPTGPGMSHMDVRRRPLTIFNVRPFLMAFVWDSLSRLETMDLSHFRCTPVNGHCFAPHFCLSEGAIAPQRPMCFWLISSRKPMCSTWFYRFAEFSYCSARQPISSIEIDVGAVRVKVSHWQDSIPLSSRLCPSFSSRSPHRRPRVFRLVYRPYRSFRFVFSSFVVSHRSSRSPLVS